MLLRNVFNVRNWVKAPLHSPCGLKSSLSIWENQICSFDKGNNFGGGIKKQGWIYLEKKTPKMLQDRV